MFPALGEGAEGFGLILGAGAPGLGRTSPEMPTWASALSQPSPRIRLSRLTPFTIGFLMVNLLYVIIIHDSFVNQ
jgi:hypothetical protein